jgi:hypothetical protein
VCAKHTLFNVVLSILGRRAPNEAPGDGAFCSLLRGGVEGSEEARVVSPPNKFTVMVRTLACGLVEDQHTLEAATGKRIPYC